MTAALAAAASARADRIRTQAGIGYDGKIVGMDAGGLVLEHAGGRVRVHTIGFLYPRPGTSAEEVLRQIAAENGGNYKFVSEGDLGR